MKRVLQFDLDNGTLEELEEMQAELKKKRESLLLCNAKAYEEFIAKAVKIYITNDISVRKSLKRAYDECNAECWLSIHNPLDLCPTCSDKDVRTLKYRNAFNPSVIVCEECYGSPSFHTVFTKDMRKMASNYVKDLTT